MHLHCININVMWSNLVRLCIWDAETACSNHVITILPDSARGKPRPFHGRITSSSLVSGFDIVVLCGIVSSQNSFIDFFLGIVVAAAIPHKITIPLSANNIKLKIGERYFIY